jgi:hypothetical protein
VFIIIITIYIIHTHTTQREGGREGGECLMYIHDNMHMYLTTKTHLSGINEFLHYVSSSKGGVLLEYTAHHPYSEPVEELDALFNPRGVLCRLSSMSIHAELLNL